MSIRTRLILILIFATCSVWLSAVVWIENSTRAELQRVLDARLREAAEMVSSLISDGRVELAQGGGAAPVPVSPGGGYERRLSCQIWALDGGLVGQSRGAPAARLAGAGDQGYSTSTVEGERWRVYTVVNEDLGVRIMAGDAQAVRDGLVRDVIGGLLLPAAVMLPLLAALIWGAVSRGLAPLDRLAETLRLRRPDDLAPLPAGPVPPEVMPVRDALNALFQRVEKTRETERDFTAFAAHELKTPLAGLRIQAQIARMAPDAPTREEALREIETSVERTDRLVRQLLELTAVETAEDPGTPTGLAQVLDDVLTELEPLARRRGVTINEPDVPDAALSLRRFLLHAALRNVIENAILASPKGSAIRIGARCTEGACRLSVIDAGPGIPDDIRARATDCFVRGRGASIVGSGLGLSIVAAAMERLGGTLEIPPRDGGQAVILHLPRSVDPADRAGRDG